jgi:Fibrinogen beta and gamma chains, C-terminal globular domain
MQLTGLWKQPYSSYKSGFGFNGTEFWLGLERIHLLTSTVKYRLRVELISTTNYIYWIEYSTFAVGDEARTQYQLSVVGGVR